MPVLQFVFGLGLIVAMLAVETVILVGLAWMVLTLVRHIPLVGRKHRHERWEDLHAHRTHAD